MSQSISFKTKRLRLFLRILGWVFLCMGLLYYEFLAQVLGGEFSLFPPPLYPFQLVCLLLSFVFLGMDVFLGRSKRLRYWLAHNLVLNSLLVAISILLPLTILELSLRPFCTFVNRDVSIFQEDEQLGWRLRPHVETYRRANIRINAKGLRGSLIAYSRRDDTTRILFLGDSIAYGLRLEYEKTIPYQAEVQLARETGRRVECINAGVPGYSTWQQYLYYKNELYKYKPNVVVLCFCLNDVLNTYTGVKYGDYGKDDPVPFIEENWIDTLIRRSAIVYMGKQWYHRFRYGRTLRENAIYREELRVAALKSKAEYPEIQAAWETTYRFILRIADRAQKEKGKFLFVVFPYEIPEPDSTASFWRPAELMAFAKKHDFVAIDMLREVEADRKETGRRDYKKYFQDNCHPTARGAQITAKAIREAILERGW
ncbi:hypothetical protein GF373_05640 [bacterium]|nr:hypothetical protein [bacterium]